MSHICPECLSECDCRGDDNDEFDMSLFCSCCCRFWDDDDESISDEPEGGEPE
jgi:hypothetical protein